MRQHTVWCISTRRMPRACRKQWIILTAKNATGLCFVRLWRRHAQPIEPPCFSNNVFFSIFLTTYHTNLWSARTHHENLRAIFGRRLPFGRAARFAVGNDCHHKMYICISSRKNMMYVYTACIPPQRHLAELECSYGRPPLGIKMTDCGTSAWLRVGCRARKGFVCL